MATLFDLAQQYLNRALPETFRYGPRTPTTPPPVTVPPQDPNAPTARILPMPSGGGDGYSVYNADPNRTRDESNYNERPYKSTVYNDAFPMMGDPMANQATGALNADGLMSYAGDKQLTGIPGAAANYLKNSFFGKGLEYLGDKMPVNQRAILENELLGQGFQLNDIGQIVSDGGDYDTAANVMSGYNANQITRQTFEKRRNKIKETMRKPGYKGNLQERLDALDEAEAKFFGGSAKATTVFNDKLKQKDIDDGFINDQGSTYDEEIPSFIIDNNIIDNNILGPGKGINAYPGMGITSTYTPSPGDLGYIAPTAPKTSGSILANNNINRINDYININPGGNQDNDGPITTAPKKTSQGLTTSQFQAFKGSSKTPSYGTGSGGLGDYQIQPSKPTKSLKTTKPGTGGGADSGGSSSGGGGTHCCTAANERGDMTLTEVKKLRAWHRKQSKIWQKGYDVWGKVIADNLVAKFKWQSDRVRDFYNHKIYGKRTIGSIYADIVIYPMSMIIGSILTVMPPILGYQENKRHG